MRQRTGGTRLLPPGTERKRRPSGGRNDKAGREWDASKRTALPSSPGPEDDRTMQHVRRKLGFVLAASSHGPLIVDRFDYRRVGESFYGVGGQILENAAFDPAEIEMVLTLLRCRRRYFGDGVLVIDCGANIGVHTIECAMAMTGWGAVLAIEAQERLFYALAGNIALNNCFNARAINAAVAAADGAMRVPVPDYLSFGSFGSLELRPRPENEFIGQKIDYSDAAMQQLQTLRLDSLALARVDLIKIDVEGMEAEVLEGGAALIARHRPIILVEWVKSSKTGLRGTLEASGYQVFDGPMNLLAVHQTDRSLEHIKTGAAQ
jgi:FkbM family methyltransferase